MFNQTQIVKSKSGRFLLIGLICLSPIACENNAGKNAGAIATTPAPHSIPPMPSAHSNAAVAYLKNKDDYFLFRFFGLGSGKTWRDIKGGASVFNSKHQRWQNIQVFDDLPGRLAASAITIQNRIYIFGGYTVAQDGSEVSTSEVFELNPESHKVTIISHMPVPVDDAVIFAWQDRYAVLISGWFNTGNVKNVQIWDNKTNQWHQATSFPGVPVFGHSGGIVENKFLVCDGVSSVKNAEGKNQFALVSDCYIGELNPNKIEQISWRKTAARPDGAKYRAAASGTKLFGARVVFVGGSDNPYNIDGIGYNGIASKASSAVMSFNFQTEQWQRHHAAPIASMDHRGLLIHNADLILLGGLQDPQKVSKYVTRFGLSAPIQ